MASDASIMIDFVNKFPEIMSKLMNHFIEKPGLTERLKTKTKMRALLEFLEPETTTGDIKKLLAANPALQEEIVRLLPTHRDQRHRLAQPVSSDFTEESVSCGSSL